MSTCNACGGIIGRDCWNPQECAAITAQMQFEPPQFEPPQGPAPVDVELAREVRRVNEPSPHPSCPEGAET